MSVFSMIRRGRQAAKEHKTKQAEKQKLEEAKVPYRHIPKHAAIDALSGGPATWRETDRPKILEQNRRRSAMTANGLGMGGMMTPIHTGMPRVNSALSHVSYPSVYASPVVQMPRTYSYNSIHPGWNNQGGEVIYSHIGPRGGSVKGKEVERVMVDSSYASRSSSKGSNRPSATDSFLANSHPATSPVESSTSSTSSQDDLEMKPVKHASASLAASVSTYSVATTTPANTRPAPEAEYFHRLHPSHSRRISDPSTSNQARGTYAPQRQGGPRVTSLPASVAGIPPVPALPQIQVGYPLSLHTSSPYVAPAFSSATPSSLFMDDYVPRSPSLGPKIASPARTPLPEEVAGPIPGDELEPPLPAITTPVLSHKKGRISKSTRFTELETISSNISAPTLDTRAPSPAPETIRKTVTHVAVLPTEFDESILPEPRNPIPPATRKPGKLTKNSGPKLVKKNRWSLRSGKSTAVAG